VRAFDSEYQGKAVEIEAFVQAEKDEGQRISYYSATGAPGTSWDLTLGYDYSPTGFGSGVVDVVFVDATNVLDVNSSGALILSDYSATDRYLIVLGDVDNQISGGNNGDYIHTGGGNDFVVVSSGCDYSDGGSEGSAGAHGDVLDFRNQTGPVTLSLASGAGIEGEAVFSATKSETETDHFTDFETLLFNEGENKLSFDGDAVLDALASEHITIIGGDGRDQIDGRLLDQGAVIDFAAGEMYVPDNAADRLTLAGFEDAVGGAGNDTITGSDQANFLAGGLGADELFGGGADDFIFFDNLDTAVNGGAGRDVGWALTLADGGGVTVDMTAQELEVLIGSLGNDTVTLSGGQMAAGGEGNDTFVIDCSGTGTHVVWGGAGADRITVNTGAPGVMVATVAGLTAEGFSHDLLRPRNHARRRNMGRASPGDRAAGLFPERRRVVT
jgi:Ca2+-binding RTX toxin-like protein